MIDPIIKKHVTLRAAPAIKAPEQRGIGDMTECGRDATAPRQDGDGPPCDGAPVEQDPFLRGVAQWRKEVPSKDNAPPHPFRDQELPS